MSQNLLLSHFPVDLWQGIAIMKTIYYGRTSTNDGQTSASPYDEAGKEGVDAGMYT
jgi:hypothetical protein